MSEEPGLADVITQQRELLPRMRAVVEAKDAENVALRAELEASRERERRLELRLAELERRLGMDSTDSGTPSSKERIGAKEARRARRQESERLDTAYLSSPAEVLTQLDALRVATGEHIARSKSEATTRAYATGFGAFELWCHRYDLSSLPAAPDTVACYLTALAARDAAVATLRTRIVAISQAHKAAGYPPPAQSETVRRTMAGIARAKGTRQRQVAPLRIDMLKAMLAATPEDETIGVRDRAILLIGFAGGFRRSELAALDAEDLKFVESGVDILIRRSKTDQEGAGRTVGIANGRHEETDPVLALRRWITVSGVTTGALFLRIRPNSSA